MEIVKRNPDDTVTEQMVEELTNTINEHILEKIFNQVSENTLEVIDKAKEWKDFFKIITVNRAMNYLQFKMIDELINMAIKNGFITRKYKDDKGTVHIDQISLDELESVSFIYDAIMSEDTIVQMHKYKTTEEPLQPVFMQYLFDEHNPTICNGYFAPNKIVDTNFYI